MKKKKIKNSSFKVSVWLLAMMIVANVVLAVFLRLPFFDLVVAITGITYIAILSNRSIFNFLFGLVNVILYVIVAYRASLYGEVIFYLLFDIPINIIALFAWKKKVRKDFTVPVRRLKLVWVLFLVIITALATFLYGLFLRAIGGEHVFINALSTCVDCIATVLMWKRFREQWYGWILVYVVSIILWTVAGNLLMVTMSIGCLIFSVRGFFEWRFHSRKNW